MKYYLIKYYRLADRGNYVNPIGAVVLEFNDSMNPKQCYDNALEIITNEYNKDIHDDSKVIITITDMIPIK